MKRREFLVTSALGTVGALTTKVSADSTTLVNIERDRRPPSARATRKILIAGGQYGPVFIRYMAQLTGKPRPKLLYLPTASADSPQGSISWFRNCAPVECEPSVQESFIASTRQDRGWDEVLLSVDGIVASGGNTLNQQAIWKGQGIDQVLRQ